MTDEGLARERLGRLPPIRRARLWRLYAEDGSRFLDFWQDGGRSILGAKGTGIGTAAKAALDMGLTRPFPSVREVRLARELLRRHPGFSALRLYADEGRARAAASSLGPGSGLEILRPFAAHYRRGAEEGRGTASQGGVALPLLPCPAALAPGVLLFVDAGLAALARGDLVPPLALACAQRALAEFDRFEANYDEALWRRSDRRLSPFFERSGPYLYPRCGVEAYEPFFSAALGAGVLLSLRHEEPSLLPGDFDDGELARLAAALSAL